jgi:hypothetical protein
MRSSRRASGISETLPHYRPFYLEKLAREGPQDPN